MHSDFGYLGHSIRSNLTQNRKSRQFNAEINFSIEVPVHLPRVIFKLKYYINLFFWHLTPVLSLRSTGVSAKGQN